MGSNNPAESKVILKEKGDSHPPDVLPVPTFIPAQLLGVDAHSHPFLITPTLSMKLEKPGNGLV